MVWLFSRSLHYANEKQPTDRIPSNTFCGVLLRECKQRTLQIFSSIISIFLFSFRFYRCRSILCRLNLTSSDTFMGRKIENLKRIRMFVYVGMEENRKMGNKSNDKTFCLAQLRQQFVYLLILFRLIQFYIILLSQLLRFLYGFKICSILTDCTLTT